FFHLYPYVVLLHLPSFPTRRSSDLDKFLFVPLHRMLLSNVVLIHDIVGSDTFDYNEYMPFSTSHYRYSLLLYNVLQEYPLAIVVSQEVMLRCNTNYFSP